MSADKNIGTNNTVPSFEKPQSSKSQRGALRMAGALLRTPDPRDSAEVFRYFVREVGGFKPNDHPATHPARYNHPDAQMVTRWLLSDETTDGGPVQRPGTVRDHEDANGLTTIESAVARTLDGQRRSSELGTRGRIARGLVRFALRGTDISEYTDGSARR